MSFTNPPENSRIISSSLTAGRGWFRKSKRLGLVAVGFVVILLASWLLIPGGGKPTVAPYHGEATSSSATPYEPPQAVMLPPPVVAPPVKQAQPPISPPFQTIQAQPTQHYSGVYTYAGSNMPDYLKKMVDAAGAKAQATATEQERGGIKFATVSLPGTQAFTIAHRDLMLMRWSIIICTLDTQVVTGAAGDTPFRCRVKYAVKSPTGVTLLEAGTIVGGTYKSVVGEGDSRVIGVTAEAQSPNGVIADIGGPIGDDLGAAGVPGSVDEHWGKRVGSALILALVDNGFSVLQSEIQKNSNQTNINVGGGSGGGGGLNQIGQQLLAKSINIPPTIVLNQGATVALWVTKYVSFENSYKLETAR